MPSARPSGSRPVAAPGPAGAPVSPVEVQVNGPLPGARPGRDPARAIKRGPSRLPPEVVAATQRDRLYDGLVHTVAEKGYANARVSDICQAAGVTRPVFYALFAGKQEAYLATYRHGTAVLLGLMEQAYAAADDWRAGVREALRVLLDVLAAVPAFARMAIVEIDGTGPVARAARAGLLEEFERFFVDAPTGPELRLRDDLSRNELIKSVVGGVHSTVYRYVAAGRTAELADTLPLLTYFTVVPFVGRDAAAREFPAGPDQEKTTVPCARLDRASTER